MVYGYVHEAPYMTEAKLEAIALFHERMGDWVKANWIRSQSQEILACFDRGGQWPEVWGV